MQYKELDTEDLYRRMRIEKLLIRDPQSSKFHQLCKAVKQLSPENSIEEIAMAVGLTLVKIEESNI